MPSRYCLALVFAISACGQVALGEEVLGPAKDVPELQVLENLIGTWDVKATSKDSPPTKGQFTAKWVLDGHFVRTTGTVSTGDAFSFDVTNMMTFDAKKKVYRMWSFMSNGLTVESEATWDAKTKTLTRLTRYDDVTQKTISRFDTPGVEQWNMIVTDKDKNVVSEMKGTNTRQKEN